ncbi:choice-of-anchor B family protein [Candidatus Marinimicrobia bacterium MT.SAG.3]|nr:choice-of-anchor B family protein [Candidatus Marinimicrobia bacterium MT.SAG.3]
MNHSALACLKKIFIIFFLALAVSLAPSIAPQQAKAQEAWNVTLRGHIDPASSYSDVWGYVDSSGTEYALLGSNEGIKIVDLTNPASPTVVSTFGGGTDVKAFDHYVATSGGEIYDVSDVTNPVRVSTFPFAHNIFVSYPYLFLACPNRIYDITDPTNPVFVRGYGTDCHDITVINDTLYHAGGITGTEIFDISDINNHLLLTSFHLEGEYSHNVWPTEDRKHLLLTDESGLWGLTIWDIQDMSSPMMVAQYKMAVIHNVYVRGNYAYISHYAEGLRILNISDPTNPVEVGFYDNSAGGAWGTYPFLPSGLILISNTETGLYVVRFDSIEVASVTGIVRDAIDSTALEGTQVNLACCGRVSTTGSDGLFSFRIAEGEDILYTHKFGYHPDTLTVSLLAGETLSVVVDLSPIERGTITGMLTDTSGSGVAALLLLYLDGAPNSPWDTLWVDQGGVIEYNALPGNYRVVINPVLPYVSPLVENVVVESGVSTSLNLQLEVADVFLFDDDGGDEYETYFLSSLEELGLSASHRDLAVWGTQAVSQFGPVEEPVIIWFTGDVDSGAISQEEEDSLIAFLDAGGNLFISGQNIVENLSPSSSLLTDYLSVSYGGQSTTTIARGVEGNAVTGGLGLFALAGPGSPGNQSSLDILLPTGNADSAMLYGRTGETVAAISVEDSQSGYKIFLTGFGFEGIVSGNNRLEDPIRLLANVLTWFGVEVITGINTEVAILPEEYILKQNYPNPFNPVTTIEFSLPTTGNTLLTIYNLRGEEVARLVDGTLSAGYNRIEWNATNYASGIYFYRLQAGDFVLTRKMVLLR